MSVKEGGQRLQNAIRAALDTASQAGLFRGSTQKALEATLAKLDERIETESTGLHFHVESAPDQCLFVAHSSDPVALDVVASFMHHAGAQKLGTAQAWMLPLDGIPTNRWIRALRKVVFANKGGEPDSGLPVRLTAVWAHKDELVVATVG